MINLIFWKQANFITDTDLIRRSKVDEGSRRGRGWCPDRNKTLRKPQCFSDEWVGGWRDRIQLATKSYCHVLEDCFTAAWSLGAWRARAGCHVANMRECEGRVSSARRVTETDRVRDGNPYHLMSIQLLSSYDK